MISIYVILAELLVYEEKSDFTFFILKLTLFNYLYKYKYRNTNRKWIQMYFRGLLTSQPFTSPMLLNLSCNRPFTPVK